MNLGRNALEAMQRTRDEVEPTLRFAARREGSVVTIEVSDTGPGVPARVRDRLFQPFHASTRSGGTGLGLAIAAEIVAAHHGTIRLAEGTLGATFLIEIPDRVGGASRQRPAAPCVGRGLIGSGSSLDPRLHSRPKPIRYPPRSLPRRPRAASSAPCPGA